MPCEASHLKVVLPSKKSVPILGGWEVIVSNPSALELVV